MRKISVKELISNFSVEVEGELKEIDGMNLCTAITKNKSIMSYVTNKKYVDSIIKNEAISHLIVSRENFRYYADVVNRTLCYIVCNNPEELFYKIHIYLVEKTDFYNRYNFSTIIGDNCKIHSSAVVDDGVVIGNNVTIGASSVIRRGSVIEDDVYIGCNTTIASEGFQAIKFEIGYVNIPHVGGTRLSKNVYIGDNCDVCNSLFEGETVLGFNTRLDNHIHIGHNSIIGQNNVITAGVVLCGSVIIKDDVWIGVNTSILNKVVVGSGALVGIGSNVLMDVEKNTIVAGNPAKYIRDRN